MSIRCHADRDDDRSAITSPTVVSRPVAANVAAAPAIEAVNDSADTPTDAASSRHRCLQIRDTVAALVRTGVGGDLTFHRSALEPSRRATLTSTELVQLDSNSRADLRRAFGEHRQQLGWNAGDLRLAGDDLRELHPVPAGDLGAGPTDRGRRSPVDAV